MLEATTRVAHLLFDEKEAILYIQIAPDAMMDYVGVKEHYDVMRQLTQEKEYVTLIDVRQTYSIQVEALEFACPPEVLRNRKAAAYLNSVLSNRLTIQNLQKLLKGNVPVAIFSNKVEAVEWLRRIIV